MKMLVNAAHALDEFGIITVRSGETDKEVLMEVLTRDRGQTQWPH